MRFGTLCLFAVLTCGSAQALPSNAHELMLPPGGAAKPAPGTPVPQVSRGQYLGVSCAHVEQADAESIFVVMYPSGNEPFTGFQGLLATDQEVTPDTVHVRVPDLPDLADHTVRVKVYIKDANGKHSCDGGKVRIV